MSAPLRSKSLQHETGLDGERFLGMLPQILRQARIASRGLRAEARDELMQEVVANAYCAFVQLVLNGKAAVAYPTPLAQFALRRIRAGRRVGNRMNSRDVLSPRAGRVQRPTIESLDGHDPRTGRWKDILVEDRHAGPADIAAARIDIAAWLGTLSPRHRQIVQALATGETTSTVARKFNLTNGRISQLRQWFRAHWERFQAGRELVDRAA
jgi:DNA-binding NarL/FixJ family response regulator